MKKEYIKPIVVVMTLCNSENILSASRPKKTVIIEEDGIINDNWEVD